MASAANFTSVRQLESAPAKAYAVPDVPTPPAFCGLQRRNPLIRFIPLAEDGRPAALTIGTSGTKLAGHQEQTLGTSGTARNDKPLNQRPFSGEKSPLTL